MEAIFCQKLGNFIAQFRRLLMDKINQKLKFLIPTQTMYKHLKKSNLLKCATLR
jgi:hypothetical protein